MLKRTGKVADKLPLLLQKSFSRPRSSAAGESDLALSLNCRYFRLHSLKYPWLNVRSILIVPTLENPETWPV